MDDFHYPVAHTFEVEYEWKAPNGLEYLLVGSVWGEGREYGWHDLEVFTVEGDTYSDKPLAGDVFTAWETANLVVSAEAAFERWNDMALEARDDARWGR